jgi:hypothetical protein
LLLISRVGLGLAGRSEHGKTMARPIVQESSMTKLLAQAVLSRRRVLAGLAAAMAQPLGPALARKRLDAKGFLESIYQRYVGGSNGAKPIPLDTAKAVRDYFTVGLASLIIEDQAASAKRGEPPALDNDPFVGLKDWDISNLVIEAKESGALKATGTVTFENSGSTRKIILELLRSGDDWRIADIKWESGSLRGLYRRKATRDAQAPTP